MPRSNSPLYKLTMYLNTGIAGWSEGHFLNSNTRASAITAGTDICNARRTFLPPSAKIEFARVSEWGSPRDGNAVEDGIGPGIYAETLVTGVAPEPSTSGEVKSRQTCDFPATALYWRLEGNEGGTATRLLRGLPDYAIQDLQLWSTVNTVIRTTAVTAPTDTVVKLAANGTLTLALRYYLYLVTQNTIQVNPKKDETGSYSWQYTNKIIFRKVGSRKVGRPFNLYRGRA